MSSPQEKRDLLRFLTAGSVDDGKSTLIGRLLYECNGIYDDQLSSVRKASSAKKLTLDLSLITDGLTAEREQGITIDVAYRYFSTQRRKFIIADAPGHEQYTRNLAAACSTAEVAVILIDARKGLLKQTRRHTLIGWLMGIRRMIVVVNKMDLVAFQGDVFHSIRDQFTGFSVSLKGTEFDFVPVSALSGENVSESNGCMRWYKGPSLLELLETIPAKRESNAELRFPVQSVVRPNQDFRGYAGQICSGVLRPGQEIIALPSGQRSTVKEIFLHTRSLPEAVPPQSVVLTTTDHIDLGRGDMIVSPERMPTGAKRIVAYLIWMFRIPLRCGARYLIKHTTKLLCGEIRRLDYKIDIDTFESVKAVSLEFNEIGQVQIDLDNLMFCDPYQFDRTTGSFIVIDPSTNETVAAGMIREAIPAQIRNVLDEFSAGPRIAQRRGLTVWFTGLSGSGKTTLCRTVATELLARGLQVEVMDGDVIRRYLCKDLGFSKKDRDENIRRIAFVAQLLTRNGMIVLVSAISPYRMGRDAARRAIGDFMEVYVNTPLRVCEMRDPKGLYGKARLGEIHGFTGIDDPYEAPLAPEIVCNTDAESNRKISSKIVTSVLEYISLNSLKT